MGFSLGFSEEDFTNIVSDTGVTVSWESVTKAISNISGDETLSYATAVNKTVVFTKRTETNAQGKSGIVDMGDTIMLVDKDYGFKKDDRITYGGHKYLIVDEPIRREINGIQLFDTCTLVEID